MSDPYPRATGPAPSLEELRRRRDEIKRVALRHGARMVSVFGSVARGDAGAGSDLDVLVDMSERGTLFEQAALQGDLEDLLECPARHDDRRIEAGPRGDSRTDRTGGGSAVSLRATGGLPRTHVWRPVRHAAPPAWLLTDDGREGQPPDPRCSHGSW